MKPTDKQMIDFIQRHKVWLTFGRYAGANYAWRCHVGGRHFLHQDIRERRERIAYGRTARAALAAAMKDTSPVAQPRTDLRGRNLRRVNA